MLSITKSMALHGLEGFLIDVQVDISSGMPSWDIVGLPDVSVKEAKERVRTAIKNSGYELFSRKIVVNLAPANIKKEGSIFDLPIAVGILKGLEAITQTQNEDILMIGELSLNGSLNPINGALPICIEAKKQGIKKIILPKQASWRTVRSMLPAFTAPSAMHWIVPPALVIRRRIRWIMPIVQRL